MLSRWFYSKFSWPLAKHPKPEVQVLAHIGSPSVFTNFSHSLTPLYVRTSTASFNFWFKSVENFTAPCAFGALGETHGESRKWCGWWKSSSLFTGTPQLRAQFLDSCASKIAKNVPEKGKTTQFGLGLGAKIFFQPCKIWTIWGRIC